MIGNEFHVFRVIESMMWLSNLFQLYLTCKYQVCSHGHSMKCQKREKALLCARPFKGESKREKMAHTLLNSVHSENSNAIPICSHLVWLFLSFFGNVGMFFRERKWSGNLPFQIGQENKTIENPCIPPASADEGGLCFLEEPQTWIWKLCGR